jgi:hypothetical protein
MDKPEEVENVDNLKVIHTQFTSYPQKYLPSNILVLNCVI